MPAYNAEKYIAEAIDSILGQTFEDFEFIILNDCSTDRTEEIILSYDDPRIVYLKNEQNLGVAATLNRGLEVAKGEYIARMDADDISHSYRLAKQAAFLDSFSGVICCGSAVEKFGSAQGLCVYPDSDDKIKTTLLLSCPIAHPSVMLRASILRTNKITYDLAFEKVEDYQLWTVLSEYGAFHNLQEPLIRYRIHAEQVSTTASLIQHEGRLKIAAKLLGQAGITDSKDIYTLVSIFDGTALNNQCFFHFSTIAPVLAEQLLVPNRTQLRYMLKCRLIEVALEKKKFLPIKCLPLVGIKAFIYVYWKGLRS